MKTPLTIIDADAEVLEMDFGENEWLSDIQSQTRRLADLTNNLILLSRMEEERTKRIDGGFSVVGCSGRDCRDISGAGKDTK